LSRVAMGVVLRKEDSIRRCENDGRDTSIVMSWHIQTPLSYSTDFSLDK